MWRGIGQLEIKAMRERNYPMRFAAGITGAASIISPVIPPSIAMVVYGWLFGNLDRGTVSSPAWCPA